MNALFFRLAALFFEKRFLRTFSTRRRTFQKAALPNKKIPAFMGINSLIE